MYIPPRLYAFMYGISLSGAHKRYETNVHPSQIRVNIRTMGVKTKVELARLSEISTVVRLQILAWDVSAYVHCINFYREKQSFMAWRACVCWEPAAQNMARLTTA